MTTDNSTAGLAAARTAGGGDVDGHASSGPTTAGPSVNQDTRSAPATQATALTSPALGAAAPPHAPEPAQAPASARTLLAGRVLVAAGSQEQHKYPLLIQAQAASLATTGLVVGGAEAAATMRRIRHTFPNLFLMCDQTESDKFAATAEDPFPQAGGDELTLFPKATLAERIQSQINAGASVALTPTGYIAAGDRMALRAVITTANKLKRSDVVVLLPLAPTWLTGAALKTVMAAVRRSKHPVAITLCESSTDPMSRKGVLAGAHQLAAMDDPPMFHKVDLAGFDVMAHGALAVSIGVIASKRRGAVPTKGGFASRTNRGANVMVRNLLRFRRSLDMRDQWYASRSAPDCFCAVCGGQSIDRFGSEDYDCVVAAQHNALAVIAVINEAHDGGGFASAWASLVHDAIAAHEALSQYVGAEIDPPAELKAWNKALPYTSA